MGWDNLVDPYVKNTGVKVCPSALNRNVGKGNTNYGRYNSLSQRPMAFTVWILQFIGFVLWAKEHALSQPPVSVVSGRGSRSSVKCC